MINQLSYSLVDFKLFIPSTIRHTVVREGTLYHLQSYAEKAFYLTKITQFLTSFIQMFFQNMAIYHIE